MAKQQFAKVYENDEHQVLVRMEAGEESHDLQFVLKTDYGYMTMGAGFKSVKELQEHFESVTEEKAFRVADLMMRNYGSMGDIEQAISEQSNGILQA